MVVWTIVIRVIGTPVSVPSGSQVTATVRCTQSTVLVGGGYSTTGNLIGDQFVHVYDNFPSTSGTAGRWTVRVGSETGGVTVTPYALCSSL